MERDQVSINTVQGRVVGQLALGEFQRQYLYDLSWEIGGAELMRRKNTWYLCVTQSKRAPDPEEPRGVIGIDLGIVNLATTDKQPPSLAATRWKATSLSKRRQPLYL